MIRDDLAGGDDDGDFGGPDGERQEIIDEEELGYL
jgi:hypothetical protein